MDHFSRPKTSDPVSPINQSQVEKKKGETLLGWSRANNISSVNPVCISNQINLTWKGSLDAIREIEIWSVY